VREAPPVNKSEVQGDTDRKQRIAEASGQLVAATLRLLGELVPGPGGQLESAAHNNLRDQLASATETDTSGRPVLTLTLPDPSALDDIARLLGGLLARVSNPAAMVN
jgi:hypothetical protein